jgi:hypothetical protein
MNDGVMNDLNTTLKDTLYVTVGFGVIAFQKAQVRRRQVSERLEAQLAVTREQVQRLARDVEHRVEPVIDQLEGRLPDPARDLVRQARAVARPYVRSILGEDGQTPGPDPAHSAA